MGKPMSTDCGRFLSQAVDGSLLGFAGGESIGIAAAVGGVCVCVCSAQRAARCVFVGFRAKGA